jgi:predicted Co/Zn/Cd cation transporter (cation efflux family)
VDPVPAPTTATTPGSDILPGGTPAAPPLPSPRGNWALLNLLLTLVAAVVSILLLAHYRRQRREFDYGVDTSKTLVMSVLSFVALAVAVLLFLLTQTIGGIMVFKDDWTIWHAVIVVVEAVVAIFALRAGEEGYDDAGA